MRGDGLGERQAESLGLGDLAELALDRLGGLVGDDLDAVVEGQTRLDAAHDDVDGVGELVDEVEHALLAPAVDEPARQAEETDDGGGGGQVKRRAEQEGDDQRDNAAGDADHPERAARPVEAGLLHAHRERRRLAVLGLRLLLLLELLQGLLNRLAAARIGLLLAARRGGRFDMALALHELEPSLGRLLALDAAVEQRIGNAAGRQGGQSEDRQKRNERTEHQPALLIEVLVVFGVGGIEGGREARPSSL